MILKLAKGRKVKTQKSRTKVWNLTIPAKKADI